MYHTSIFLVLPIGDYLYCTGFFAAKRVEFTKLLSKLEDVSVIDPQVAFNMLRLGSGFCRIVHLARSTPPSAAADSLKIMDSDVRSCFTKFFSIDLSESAWCQSQLSLRFGGLGLCSLSLTTQVLLLLHHLFIWLCHHR